MSHLRARVQEFTVSWEDGQWWMTPAEGEAEAHHTDGEALRAADLAARRANGGGEDSRVLWRGPDGRRHLVRSYGRHPLLTVQRGGEARA